MAYNQSRNAVLNKEERLGTRYLRFLRCVSHHLKKGECFQAKLHSLDSGFKTESNPEIACKKLISALEKLESGRDFFNPAKIGQNVQLASNHGMFFGNGEYDKLYKIFDWHVLLRVQKNEEKNKQVTRKSIEKEFGKKYIEISPLLNELKFRTSELVGKKLKFISNELAFEPQVRVKSWDSTVDKLVRLNSRFENLTELQDLVGVRVVTTIEKDLLEVEKVIGKSFAIIKKYRPEYISNKESNAKHIIVKLKNPSTKDKVIAEVQIMTLSQFLLNKVSHKLHYKNVTRKKKKVGLNRLSALLDVVDSEIERCFDNR
ncbi:RelA/SpoT domain-containing protein [Vibrio antiquarius]|uniref:RelA/SpoT domain-containing protein n=1 Tax=Vibrio antiquarius (strain Ex25) TaxID=150340 RepID=UPI002658AA50|nr:RelA/SpoT domain-containing protein [Vibrio antiquarius]MCR9845953.1 RelA/SpoT domain-containing protein [Vibrio antiquarius]MCR9913187.1 RelA/SpoT domain-containing protein [Vibrio antiquarius]